jgi:hypothetical protein
MIWIKRLSLINVRGKRLRERKLRERMEQIWKIEEIKARQRS